MQILDPGHRFRPDFIDETGTFVQYPIQYVKREGDKYPGNKGHYPGTTIQEICRIQISRLKYVFRQIPCPEDLRCIDYQRYTIHDLEIRAAIQHNRTLHLTADEIQNIEELPTCKKCGHIKPETHVECNAA